MSNAALARRRPAPGRVLAPVRTASPAVVVPVEAPTLRPTPRAPARGTTPTAQYQERDLAAVAQIAHHYLLNGAPELAKVLLEGLTEASPKVAHFHLLLGLALDHLGERTAAILSYRTAMSLDPSDPRAALNLAELSIDADRLPEARRLLQQAAERATTKSDQALARKAHGLLRHLDRFR